MMFGAWGNPDHDESVRIIHEALDAGINFIDTADVYGSGESEEMSARHSKTAATTSASRPSSGQTDWRRPTTGQLKSSIMRAVEDRYGA